MIPNTQGLTYQKMTFTKNRNIKKNCFSVLSIFLAPNHNDCREVVIVGMPDNSGRRSGDDG